MFDLGRVMLSKHKRAYLGIQNQPQFPNYHFYMLKKKLRSINNRS